MRITRLATAAIKRFSNSQSGSAITQSAVLFGAIGLAVAGLAAPYLNSVAEKHAQNRSLGIDRAITGSVDKSRKYTIRRSVLDPEGTVINR